jgi:hypothetical protein
MRDLSSRLRRLEAIWRPPPEWPVISFCFDQDDGSPVLCRLGGDWVERDALPADALVILAIRDDLEAARAGRAQEHRDG